MSTGRRLSPERLEDEIETTRRLAEAGRGELALERARALLPYLNVLPELALTGWLPLILTAIELFAQGQLEAARTLRRELAEAAVSEGRLHTLRPIVAPWAALRQIHDLSLEASPELVRAVTLQYLVVFRSRLDTGTRWAGPLLRYLARHPFRYLRERGKISAYSELDRARKLGWRRLY